MATTGEILYKEKAQSIAQQKGIPPALFAALIEVESGWNAFAVGEKGEVGLTQLMPATAQELRVAPFNPEQNLIGGATYLAQQYERHKDWRKALAAYNAGPSNADSQAGLAYADKVLAKAGMTQADPTTEEDRSLFDILKDWFKVSKTDDFSVIPEITYDPNAPSPVTGVVREYAAYFVIIFIAVIFIAFGAWSLVNYGAKDNA